MLPHHSRAHTIEIGGHRDIVGSIFRVPDMAGNIGFVKKRYLMRMVRRTWQH
jgi:hypothetical protein